MKRYADKVDVPKPDRNRDCWKNIANDPVKLRYWRDIARLWKESLDVDVRLVKGLDDIDIEKISFSNHLRSL